MADFIKWIKLVVDIFEDEKILLLESMPDADGIIIIWIKLLCLAGKLNNSGVFVFKNGQPYTPKMLATIFRREEEVVSKALTAFEFYGMIQMVDNVITISNWGRHQSIDRIEANKAYMREYMRKYRNKQKAIATGAEERKVNGKVNPKVNFNTADENSEKDKNIDEESDTRQESGTNPSSTDDGQTLLDYNSIVNAFNTICKSLPKVVKLTENRKKSMQAAAKILGSVTFDQLFEKVENSDFLTGRVKDWHADFDWIMKPENIVKILEGKYDGQKKGVAANCSDHAKYKNLTMEVK